MAVKAKTPEIRIELAEMAERFERWAQLRQCGVHEAAEQPAPTKAKARSKRR